MPDYDRQVTGFQISTVLGTIFFTPINFSAIIHSFKYAAPITSGTLTGTIVALLQSQSQGTLTGTVDVAELIPGIPNIRESLGGPVGRIEGGQFLVGVIVVPTGATASIEGVVQYEYIPGRLIGQQ